MGQIKEEVEGLMTRLEVAADMDNQSVASQRPAVHKLSMLGDLNTVSPRAVVLTRCCTAQPLQAHCTRLNVQLCLPGLLLTDKGLGPLLAPSTVAACNADTAPCLQIIAQKALHKFFLDAGLLDILRQWLELLPDRTLPNIKVLPQGMLNLWVII